MRVRVFILAKLGDGQCMGGERGAQRAEHGNNHKCLVHAGGISLLIFDTSD